MPTAEQVTDPVAEHGEGPVWSDAWSGLRWVDMLAGDVLTLDTSGALTRRNVGKVAAIVRPRTNGGIVIARERDIVFESPAGDISVSPELWSDTSVRMNEGGCDPDGRFYCGSMAYDQKPGGGALFRIDLDGSAHKVLSGVSISNGLDWNPDGSLAYYVDTPRQSIDVFDYSSEDGLSQRRKLVSVPADLGAPDGLTVDSDGGIWVALWGGGAVHRYTPDGRLDEIVEVPASQVTACTLGGPRLDELFITTSRLGRNDSRYPLAGSVFSCRVGVAGLPVRPYRG